MKKTVTYKGNNFTYTLHNVSSEGNGKKGYVAFVDMLNGCTASTQNNSIRELKKNLRLAIKDWLEPISLTNEERQRLESLERLVRSEYYFYKTMADNLSEEWVKKGFDAHMASIQGCMFEDLQKELKKSFKAGIQYALEAPTEGE
jgi:predicted RNase H-like HicB family nuclease